MKALEATPTVDMQALVIVESVTVNNQIIEFKSAGNEIYTDSLTVARVFDKRHGDVLRAIERGIGERKNAFSHYFGLQGLKHKMYLLTRDQFTFLVMSFNGAKANAWKLEYISAFNKIVESHRGLTVESAEWKAEAVRLKEEAKAREQALLPKTRATLDNMRRVYFKKIGNYFIANGENEKAFNVSLIRVYNLLHILVVGDIAVNILRDRVTQGIQSHNSGHSTVYLADYAVALNYYTYTELDEFNKILNGLLSDVSKSIDSNIHLTPARVRKSFNTKLMMLLEERRNFFEGMDFQGKSREAVNRLINDYVYDLIDTDTFNLQFNQLKDGRVFTL